MSTNREQNKKLLAHEKPIWRRTFESRLHAGLPVEAATKQAWHAVKVWHEVGAYNEPTQEEPSETGRSDYKDAFGWIREWLNTMQSDVVLDGAKTLKLWEAVRDFDESRLDVEQFRDALAEIVSFVD